MNALVINDDCQTPLDVARAKGYTNVVRTIEVCLVVEITELHPINMGNLNRLD